jgi:hypothetical protein
MSLRRELLSYLGVGLAGAVAGFYAGALELLGLQSTEEQTTTKPTTTDETQTTAQINDDKNTATETAIQTETKQNNVFFDGLEDGTNDGWQKEDRGGLRGTGLITMMASNDRRFEGNWAHKMERSGNMGQVVAVRYLNREYQAEQAGFVWRGEKDEGSENRGFKEKAWIEDSNRNKLLKLRFNSEGDGSNEEPGVSLSNTSTTYSYNTVADWLEIDTKNISYDQGTFDFYINGEAVATDINFFDSGFSGINAFGFNSNQHSTKLYQDNLYVGQPPTETGERQTTTSTTAEISQSRIDGFEDGNIDEWQYLNLADKPGRGSFRVTEDAIAGDYSLLIESDGNESQNMIATTEKVLDGSRDFALSFKFFTPDPDNRGPLLRLFTQNGTDFIGEDPTPERDDSIAIRVNKQIRDDGDLIFSGENFDRPNIMTDTIHKFRVEKRDSTATLYFDGEEVAQGNVDLRTEYRIGLSTSGAWGSPSTIKYDDITIEY